MFDIAVPDIEEGMPLPSRFREAMPDLTPAEELEMRANTARLLAELSDVPLVSDESTQAAVREVQAIMQTGGRPDFNRYPNEALAFLAEMVEQYSHAIIPDLTDLRMYIVNKLINEIETAKTPKDRIAALSKLGEIDGVDAFKKRSEVTMQVKPIQEIEKELLSVLEGIEYSVRPVESVPSQRRLADANDVVELKADADDVSDGQDDAGVYE